jgi:DNA-binding NtrC family response regulator
MQVKLLRALQEREIRRIGESRPRPVDVRVVAATNRDLAAEVEAGRFRRDLYYRLRVIELRVPPLRERADDVVPLARFFLAAHARALGRPVTGFSSQAARLLKAHRWPGNVRELQNAMEYAVALCAGAQVRPEDLPEELHAEGAARAGRGGRGGRAAIRPLEAVEREHVLQALQATEGDKVEAAELLGIGLATLYRKLKAYGAG